MNKVLMMVNVSIDEDGYVNVERGVLKEYKYRGFIREDGNSGIIEREGLENVKREMLENGVNGDWFKGEGIEEGRKLREGLDEVEGLGVGMFVRWGVEYDDNLMVIFEVERDEENDVDEYVEGIDDCIGWYNREYDEGEFKEVYN